MDELNICIFCGKEPEKPRQYGYQIAPRRNTCYCIDHSCGNGIYVSVHGYSREEVVEKWNKIMSAADVAPVVHGQCVVTPNPPSIFRGKIGGKEKYCRILIRRKRAPLKEAIDYFSYAVQEGDRIIPEYSEQEQTELREQQACFVTALVALTREATKTVCERSSTNETTAPHP